PLLLNRSPPRSPLFPYTTLFRSTSGLVGQIFGVQYMAMLYGFAFLSHQVGSFLGIWMGGLLHDLTGSYDVVWWSAVALGFVAARSEEHTSELQSRENLVCRLLLE